LKLSEVLELLKTIKLAYFRFEVNEEVARLWYSFLCEESYDDVKARLVKHIRESKFEPTISELLPNYDDDKRKRYNQEVMAAQHKTYEPRLLD
jgi:hypothetical protein